MVLQGNDDDNVSKENGMGSALRNAYAMSGTDIAYRATECLRDVRPVLISAMLLPAGFGGVCKGEGTITSGSSVQVKSAIGLRACYAMSGTDLAYGAIWLRKVRY
eukprot:884941-Rhodomonas_salina.4